MYVYVNPTLLNRVTPERAKIIQRTIDRLEANPDPLLFNSLFSPRFPLWVKRVRRDHRLIAQLRQINDTPIAVIWALLYRGSDDYAQEFLQNPAAWEERHITVTLDQLQDWLTAQQATDPIVREPVPHDLLPWLQANPLIHQENQVIFESDYWVNQEIGQREDWPSIHNLIYHLADSPTQGKSTQQNSPHQHHTTPYKNVNILTDSASQLSVLYSYLCPHQESHRDIFLLLAAFDHQPSASEIAQVGNRLNLFGVSVVSNRLLNVQTVDDIARFARRSYPKYLAYYPEVWHDIQRDTGVNLALSGEEEDLLHHLRFPAFINGRAGSGKSTMLHYAFAYYCDLYLKSLGSSHQNPSHQGLFRPLFLTYNDRLTTIARTVVKKVLASHAAYSDQRDDYVQGASLEPLNHCFQSFQGFLKKQLPRSIVVERFPKDNYLSFHHFKQHYNHSFPGKHHVKPEICWHAIRTYIKGFFFEGDPEQFLGPDEYQNEVVQAHKSIDPEDFQAIYEQVWPWYTHLQTTQQRWDDQDLVRAVLQALAQGEIEPDSFTAIFCDEAQDFTHIELQVILRLSIWSRYQLRPPVENLPFAFAGDPLQTLNPTGFKWDSLRASFYEQILVPLDPDRRLWRADQTNLHELHQNYRSTRAIVHLSNGVNLWRRVLFGQQDIHPQKPWWQEDNTRPQLGILNQHLTPAELKHHIDSGVVVILPCDEGGEAEFLRNWGSPWRDLFQNSSSVYSAQAIKGMEFSTVLVIGFGEEFHRLFGGQSLTALTPNGQNWRLQYFLNKLYVAVTRATQVLGLVDTERGDRCLWQALRSEEIARFLQQVTPSHDEKMWRMMTPQRLVDYAMNTKVWTEKDPLTLAHLFLAQGIDQQDLRFLTSAATNFQREADYQREVDYCQAWMLRIQDKFREAGLAFLKIPALHDPQWKPSWDAWACFWKGLCWSELWDWCQHPPDGGQDGPPHDRLAPFVQAMVPLSRPEALSFDQRLSVLEDWTTCFATQVLTPDLATSWEPSGDDRSWIAIVDHYTTLLDLALQTQPWPKPDLLILAQTVLADLVDLGFPHDRLTDLRAACAYALEAFGEAVSLWEQCHDRQYQEHPRYYRAKAAVTIVPEKIRWLDRAEAYDEITQLWQHYETNHTDDRPKPTWEPILDQLRQALDQTQHHHSLVELDVQQHNWFHALMRLERQTQRHDPPSPDRRLQLVQRLGKDTQVNAEQVETHVRQILKQALETAGLTQEMLDLAVQTDQWVRILNNLRKTSTQPQGDWVIRQATHLQRQFLRDLLITLGGQTKPTRESLEALQHRKDTLYTELLTTLSGSHQGLVKSFERSLTHLPRRYTILDEKQRLRLDNQILGMARTLLSEFVTRTTELAEWEPTLTRIKEASAAFDRLGEFLPALKFYERFRQGATPEVCEFAREQWIQAKLRQANFSERQKDFDRAQRQRQEAKDAPATWPCVPPKPSPEALPQGKPRAETIALVPNQEPTLTSPRDQAMTSTPVTLAQITDRLQTLSPEELTQLQDFLDFLAFRRRS